MIFKPEMAEKVMRGEKTQTRRPADAKTVYKVGRDYAVQPGRGKHAIGRARILWSCEEALAMLSDEDAAAEGFASADEFFDYWAALYGGRPDPYQRVRVYALEVVPG